MTRCVCYLLVLLVSCFGWQSDLRGQATGVPAGIVSERSLPSRYEHVIADMPEKQAKISTRKEEDSVSVLRQADTTIYAVHSPSGIGGATLPQVTQWPEKVVLRLYLKGLESLTIGNDAVRWHASVTSHGDHSQRLTVKQADRETEAEADTPYWTKIAAFGADGKPIEGLPKDGGYFELQLPKVLLERSSQTLRLEWIDFYR